MTLSQLMKRYKNPGQQLIVPVESGMKELQLLASGVLVLLPRLLWPRTIYEMSLPSVEEMERKINQYTRIQGRNVHRKGQSSEDP